MYVWLLLQLFCYLFVVDIYLCFVDRSYGAVYKAESIKEDNMEVAIKILPCDEDLTKVKAEIDFLKRLSSPYVVSFIDGYNFEDELWVGS